MKTDPSSLTHNKGSYHGLTFNSSLTRQQSLSIRNNGSLLFFTNTNQGSNELELDGSEQI